jgi:hypothetical protein
MSWGRPRSRYHGDIANGDSPRLGWSSTFDYERALADLGIAPEAGSPRS